MNRRQLFAAFIVFACSALRLRKLKFSARFAHRIRPSSSPGGPGREYRKLTLECFEEHEWHKLTNHQHIQKDCRTDRVKEAIFTAIFATRDQNFHYCRIPITAILRIIRDSIKFPHGPIFKRHPESKEAPRPQWDR